ncbi:MAG: hypothetical protein HOP14_12530 [Acidobacteria bacterium]|nr:hypothetical protein [Acidobacteriota bacterium]
MMNALRVAVGMLIMVEPAGGHHSISAVYDASRSTTIDGVVVEFHYVNPHPYLIVSVPDAGGPSTNWTLELDNRNELADIGVSASTLRPGERVVVTGSRSRAQPRNLYVRKLVRPADGFEYEQVGARPRVKRP